ncbi:TPA: Exc2 family lipoprotein [Salmonella enterica subsp. enterica serovar Newport]
MKRLLLVSVIALLAGCAQTSPEHHAHHYAYQRSETLNGNFTNAREADYRLNLPNFQKMYEMGKADRAAGKPASYAKSFTDALMNQAEHSTINTSYTFAPQAPVETNVDDLKNARLYFSSLAETYLDGYEGR